MSYEKQPEPVLPNYNPSAWDSPLSAEEQEVLDSYYVKFPIAQNAPITFPSNIATNGTLKTNTISSTATDGTLTIGLTQTSGGNINIGNSTAGTTTTIKSNSITLGESGDSLKTLTLYRPITPAYAYPILAGKIGEILEATYSAVTFSTSGTADTIASLSLSQGTWILTGNCSFTIPTVTIVQSFWYNSTSSTTYALQQFGTQSGSSNFGVTNTTTVYESSTSTFQLKALFTYSGTAPATTNTAFNVQAIRIA